MVYATSENSPRVCQERVVRARSHSRRNKSGGGGSPPTHQQLYRREIKISLAPKERAYEEEEINDRLEERIVTTTLSKAAPRAHKPSAGVVPVAAMQPEVQEEVLLNLFSCNNSGSVSSDSSESLVEFEDPKLKINEVCKMLCTLSISRNEKT